MLDAGPPPNDLIDVAKVRGVRPQSSTDHAVGLTTMNHHRSYERGAAAHFDLRVLLRYSTALGQPVIFGPVFPVTRIGFRVDNLEILAQPGTQTVTLDASLDNARSSYQNWADEI